MWETVGSWFCAAVVVVAVVAVLASAVPALIRRWPRSPDDTVLGRHPDGGDGSGSGGGGI